MLRKSSPSVRIVTSDRGWILERLAKEIADRLPYVTYGTETDPAAAIQYYITYGCRGARVSPIEVALFTHREQDATAAARFDAAAREVDHAIAMSNATLQLINDLGASETSCILPGVDIDIFRPKLKIAVVGRTYHTGRKGEMLVRAVMDVPDIEWHFTGEGWPGPAEHVADADLPAFYRAMDYVLVPALNEGGPMSVLEALASGVEVIASDVGWVSDFPHIPFERGNADSLRNVLMRLREERMQLRSSVEHITWDRWAKDHDQLFRTLFDKLDRRRLPGAAGRKSTPRVRNVALVTHGLEDTTLGGPSRRVPATAEALQALSVSATVSHNHATPMADVVHAFNIWQPKTALRVAREAKRLNKPLVFSPIILDLSEAPLWQADIFRAFRGARSGNEAEAMVRHYAQVHRERMALHAPVDPEPGYQDMVTEIAELADGLIYLSERERTVFEKLVGDVGTPGYLVRNPVDARHFQNADRDLFRQAYGLKDYVVCVARIEPRKNQLMLVNALRDSNLPIVLIGHEAHPEYADLIRRFGGSNVLMIDRLEPNSDMLRSAIAGSRVFVLPSWAEGAPLTALEAGAAGANMVLSDRSGEREYIGDRARYCDPSDPDSIRDAVLEAWDAPLAPMEARELADHVAEQFSWERHARNTRDVYEDILANAAIRSAGKSSKYDGHILAASGRTGDVIFDVTTWANNPNMLSGIVRVERSIAMELIERTDISVRFVIYYSGEIGFIELPKDVIVRDILDGYLARLRSRGLTERATLSFPAGSDIIAVGSSWMMNSDYAMELAQLARDKALKLSVLMHDMTPALFPHWYEAGYGERWEQNCATVIAHTNRLLVYSESTKKDVTSFAEKYRIEMPTVSKIRLADEVGTLASKPTVEGLQARETFSHRPFVLSVGGIHLRKNYGLLYDVWLILREKMGDACPHLVIVGGVSWNGAETARVMRNDPKVSSYIHILENIDDSSLDWLYDRALMTAYPSLYEGWGLPVGESLAHGKICLSSDSSSMKEIAPELTDLINPFDRIRWASIIQHYATSLSSRTSRETEIREKFAVTSWRETTSHILDALADKIMVRPTALYNLGDIAIVGSKGDGAAYLASGWYASEAWGRWAKSRSPAIEFQFAHVPDEDVVLTMLAKVLKPGHERLRYDVRVNGHDVGAWEFPPSAASGIDADMLLNRVVIPQKIAADADKLTIELLGDRIFTVHDAKPGSNDTRRLGLGLSAFMVEEQSRASDPAILFSTREDIRAALGAGPTADLPRQFTETIHRPSVVLDKPICDFRPFCRVGTPYGADGAYAQNGCLAFAFGVARFRFDRAASVKFIIDAMYASPDHPVAVAIYLNDHCVQTITMTTDIPNMVELEIPSSVLAAADPLNVSFLSSGVKKAGVADFFISMVSFSQDMLLPSQKWPLMAPGQSLRPGLAPYRHRLPDHMLVDGWGTLEEEGIWSLGETGRIRFAVDPEFVDDCVLLLDVHRIASDQDDDHIAILTAGGAKIAEFETIDPRTASQRIMIPLQAVANPRGEIDIRLVPNNLTWPSRSAPHPDRRRLCIRLLGIGLHRFDDLPHGRMLAVDGWHEWQPEGRWTAARSATFAFRTSEQGQTPIIHADVLPRPDHDDATISLHYSVDGGSFAELPIHPHKDAGITLPLPTASNPGIHWVTVKGIEPVSPISLGINEDVRPLGLRLISISFVPTQQIEDDAWENGGADAIPAREDQLLC